MQSTGAPSEPLIRLWTITFATVAFASGPAWTDRAQAAPSRREVPTMLPGARKSDPAVINPSVPQVQPAPSVATAPPASPQVAAAVPASAPRATLDETRLTLNKWIETQQIISKEHNDWQQGKDIVQGRIELVAKEVALLDEKVVRAQAAVAESNKARDELIATNDVAKAAAAQLATAVSAMEAQVRSLAARMPEPIKARILPLLQRVPADPSSTAVSTAERFQNVLGILNELNKANSEIAVHYEIRTLADGTTSEVQVLYVGLSQAYYLSPRGDAGIGRPTDAGWHWESSPAVAPAVLTALEILQGKQPPSFVPLPMNIK